ncbi:Glycoside hydrolase 15-related [Bradyrhizobium sp. ORS 375]|uniref:glycoside hydrolase family 15 protein n=1 Tax=Bradyrhizobium sp. (strain ORS 375) TaxID=566679 RepID=UPI0002409091|nr:glycoside hydrolase family 15 protein [Bradyrhizobium sp. ORS 375]CCD91580.1 Glycoside hydrolase 15-related [Bradyrhizobium sp. ORS 375]
MSGFIDEYGLIGDEESGALVRKDGSIDWLCWPRFDSDACFAALLGTAANGCWKISATGTARIDRAYIDDTLVLQTRFETSTGVASVIDFMPPRSRSARLIRIVHGLRGRVDMRCEMTLRFDYGSAPPWLEAKDRRATARIGPDLVVLDAPLDLDINAALVSCNFAVGAGDDRAFVLSYSLDGTSEPADARHELADTLAHWEAWSSRFRTLTAWPAQIKRSLITLKALTYKPSGGMVAAATTSLPERPGGQFNWDYRFCWIRDAAFTLLAFIDAGYHEEARAWRDWLLRAVAGEPRSMRILYRIDGSRRLEEWIPDWLPGHRWTPPVRVGNAAASQRQLDIYGELVDTLFTAAKAGIDQTAQEEFVLDAVVRHVEQIWRLPDHGLWEVRGEPRHFVYSKVSAWVAIDRYVRLGSSKGHHHEQLRRMADLRNEMHQEICREGYDPGLGRFTEYYGGETIDASLLLLPLLGFLPVTDPRITRTITAVEQQLVIDGLVQRRKPHHEHNEGAFLACSCWLADCQLMQGRRDEARRTFERVLSVSNDLGLLSEEYDVGARRLSGNFPQALSHLSLIRTALRFEGAASERGGDMPAG